MHALNHFMSTQMNALANLIHAARTALASRLARTSKPLLPLDVLGGASFVQHTNPRKNQRRATIKALGGFRQFKKARRELHLAGQPVNF